MTFKRFRALPMGACGLGPAKFTLTLAGLLLAVTASAHHSFFAMYDPSKPVKITGTITRLDWANPHIYYYVDVVDADGNVTSYAVEGGTPADLQRLGVRRDVLEAGEMITVEGFLARDGSNHINGREVTFADGRAVFAGSRDGGPGEAD